MKNNEKNVTIEVRMANNMYMYGRRFIPPNGLDRKSEFPIFMPVILPKIRKK
ncbi:hypothetical protein KAJ27_08420 [bacterium]|nr:hypothetical protein [bacterium]